MKIVDQTQYQEQKNILLTLTDRDLISKIIENQKHIAIIYERHHTIFSQKLNLQNEDFNLGDIEDIVTESIFDLQDKILKTQFKILEKKDAKIKNYLFGICQNKISDRRKKTSNINLKVDIENHVHYSSHDEDDIDPKVQKWKRSLEILKTQGRKCYSLIMLTSKNTYKYKIAALTTLFNYTNDINTRNQKSKCLKKLKKINSEIKSF
jgi:DNA-directed RNA polymerase specialized sigma24 family protein